MTSRLAVFIHSCTLAVSVLAEYHDALVFYVIDYAHAHNTVTGIIVQNDALHSSTYATHFTYLTLFESYHASASISHDNLVVTIGELYAYHLVIFTDVDSIHTIGTHSAVF